MEEEFETKNPRIEIISGHKAPRVHALVAEVAIALVSGIKPEPVPSGLGGAYFLHSRNGDIIAVVKPIDEEPLAFNNPKGLVGRMLGQPGMKRSIRVGETGLRELAAYLLDHGGFAGVPPSALVKISHVTFHVNKSDLIPDAHYKVASLQRFVEHDSDAGDLGPSGFSVASVHCIGILDIRLLNLDRHSGNILVKHGQGQESYAAGACELVPIDQGFCLPESLDDPYFEWLHWPQSSIPFSEVEVEYISNLDPLKDAELLRTDLPSIRESSIRVLILCTVFLKRAAAAGLCLANIGEMMTREFCGGEENWSVLENVCINAKACLSNRFVANDNELYDGDQVKEDGDMFQFDKDCGDSSSNEVVDSPQLLEKPPLAKGKPPKIHRFASLRTMSLHDSAAFTLPNDCDNEDDSDVPSTVLDEENSSSDTDNQKVGGALMRSLSFSVNKHKIDNGGISFGKMKKEEWDLFLEIFEELLPDAFEERKSMGLLKQRLGNSCEF